MATAHASQRQRAHSGHAFLAILIVVGLIGVALMALATDQLVRDGDQGTSERVTLTAADQGEVITVARGEEIIVRLESNATTGYEWAVAQSDDTILAYLGSVYEGSSTALVGAEGIQELRFEAIGVGTTALALKYWQSWEGDTSVAERYMVIVQVSPR